MKLGLKQAGCPHDVDERSSKQLQNLVSRLNLKMPHHNKKQLEIAPPYVPMRSLLPKVALAIACVGLG